MFKTFNLKLILFLTCCYVLSSCNLITESNQSIKWELDSSVPCKIFVDSDADSLVIWSAHTLAEDLSQLTNKSIKVILTDHIQKGRGIYIGMFDSDIYHSIESFPATSFVGQWEKLGIKGDKQNLYLTGSDIRGVVYSVFKLENMFGISPWKWWADVKIKSQDRIILNLPRRGIFEKPSIQYRGIFINDEDWGLQPWAAHNFESDLGDIGPKTYEKVFQLLLRLKANTIWPAMHPCTQAFYKIKGNREIAEKYHIIIGTSHCEPMLRNNVSEWEFKKYGDYNYFTNRSNIYNYWKARIDETSNFHNLITVGMRGIHDGHMYGGSNDKDRISMLQNVIKDQREILSNSFNEDIENIPQTIVLYKEVIDLYNKGLKIPDDITLTWTDDNYGYIRHINSDLEKLRKGGSGIYYHLSYWGQPHDYLWLSTTQPGLIWEEMNKAYENGARKLWIVNVGDIKPSEYNLELFLDMAWDIHSVKHNTITSHRESWAEREFGKDLGNEVASLMGEYYRLAFIRKPEFMGWSGVEPITICKISSWQGDETNGELSSRIEAYKELIKQCDYLKVKVASHRLSAWYELVEYPVKASAYMNLKFLYAKLASVPSPKSQKYNVLSKESYNNILKLTDQYSKLENGKWDGIMSMNPRKLPVFQLVDFNEDVNNDILEDKRIKRNISDFNLTKDAIGFHWTKIDDLGYSNHSMTLTPQKVMHFSEKDCPYLEYSIEKLNGDSCTVEIRCIPTHSSTFDQKVGVQMDSKTIRWININTKGRSLEWKQNVLRNSSIVKIRCKLAKSKNHTLRVYVNQTGIVLDQLAIYKESSLPFYSIDTFGVLSESKNNKN